MKTGIKKYGVGIAILIILSLTLNLSGCMGSDDDESSNWDDKDDETDGDIDAVENEFEASEDIALTEDNLSGVWGMKFSIAYTTVLPVFKRKVQMILTGIAKLDVTHDGLQFNFVENICDLDMNIVEDIDFQVIFPQSSIEAVPVLERSAHFDDLEYGTMFTADPILDLYGIDAKNLDNPLTDPLPSEKDDPLVIDFEGDGNPGVTARINGMGLQGEVYVIFRMVRNLLGELVNNKLIQGQIDSSVEMITVAADPFVLELQLDLVPHKIPDLNRFEFRKFDKEYTCKELLEKEAQIFEYDPMDYAVPFDEDEE